MAVVIKLEELGSFGEFVYDQVLQALDYERSGDHDKFALKIDELVRFIRKKYPEAIEINREDE